MSENITLTKAALVSLLDGVLYPNPDDPGPYGPIGPIVHWAFRDLSWALLNPQSLPSRFEPTPWPWRIEPDPVPWRIEPNPEPWRLAVLARTLIDRVVTQYQFAEVMGAKGQSEKAIGAVQSYIHDVVDDWCGTRPPKWPWPWPPRTDATELRPIALLAAGAQFQKAAALDNPLQADFAAAANQLFETGIKRLEVNGPKECA